MRGKKIIFLSLFLLSPVSSDDVPHKSTMNILELQSSKVLPNFQGKSSNQPKQFSHRFNQWNTRVYPQTYAIQYSLIASEHEWEVRQIGPNSFEVLGSPIEWETPQ